MPPAGDAAAPTRDPDEAITFVPPIVFLEGAPGETVSRELVVQNQTQLDAGFVAEVVDAQEGAGDSDALDYVAPGEARRGGGTWLEPPTPARFDIAAGAQRSLPVTVEIPRGAGPGGYYAAVVFTVRDPRPGSEVLVDLRQPVPVLVTVRGDYERDLRVSVESRDGWRWRGGTASWTVELHNAGDVHEVFAGRIRADGIVGRAMSAPMRPGILLPGERRSQETKFALRDAPDAWAAHARVVDSDGNSIRASSGRLVVMPWWLLLLVALVLATVAWRLRRRDRPDEDVGDDPDAPWSPEPRAG